MVLALIFVTGCASKELPDDGPVLPTPPIAERLENADGLLAAGEYERAENVYSGVLRDLARADAEDAANEGKRKKRKDKEALTEDERKAARVRALTGRGHVALHFGRLNEARKTLADALAIDPESSDAREVQALVTLAEGDRENALLALQALKDAKPPRWRVLNALGVIADLEKRFAEAQAYYTEALEAGGEEEALLNNLGYSQLMQGNLATAQETFQKALRRYPEADRVRANLALTQARSKRYLEAQKTWGGFLKEEQAWTNVAHIAEINGDTAKAIEYYEKAIEIAPRYLPDAEAALKRLKPE